MRRLLLLGLLVLATPALAEQILGAGPSVALNAGGVYDPRSTITVYDNTTILGATSSTNLAFVWGDNAMMTSGGTLEDFALTIFNSASSAGTLLTATVLVDYYDNTVPASPVWVGGFNGTVSWAGGLGLGFYSVVSWTGLSTLSTPIELPANVVVTQQITAKTGAANRLGIIRAYPPTVGTSPAGYYQNGTWTTTEGAYYKIGIIPEPTSLALLGLGALTLLRRR